MNKDIFEKWSNKETRKLSSFQVNELIGIVDSHLGKWVPQKTGVQKNPSIEENAIRTALVAPIFKGFEDGQDSFFHSSQKHDLAILEKVLALKSEIGMLLIELSPNNLNTLMHLAERDFHPRGVGLSGKNLLNAMDLLETQHLKTVLRMEKSQGSSLQVDWISVSVAAGCKCVWENRSDKPVPKQVHLDAPGPFGRLLGDVLDYLYGTKLPDKGVPSARSALRALGNVTNSGLNFRYNW